MLAALVERVGRQHRAASTTEITKVVTAGRRDDRQIAVVDGSPINVLGDRSSLPISLQNDTDSAAVVDAPRRPRRTATSTSRRTTSP